MSASRLATAGQSHKTGEMFVRDVAKHCGFQKSERLLCNILK